MKKEAWPGEQTLPFSEDPIAQAYVNDNPSGMRLEAIADALGLTKQRVEQIEKAALRNLHNRMRLLGVKPGELEDWLSERKTWTYPEPYGY